MHLNGLHMHTHHQHQQQKFMASQRHHVVIFPYMAKGHTIPLIDLSMALSCRGLKVTIITTPSNSPPILQTISNHPSIHLKEFQFPLVQALPKNCESTDQLPSFDLYIPFLHATKQLRTPFEQFLLELSESQDLPVCVIADFFLGWTEHVCLEFGIPWLIFHGMGVFAMSVVKSIVVHLPHAKVASDYEPFHVPGIPLTYQMTKSEMPESIDDINHPISKFLMDFRESEANCWGIVVNSFVEIEHEYITCLESFYNGAKAWCLGPLSSYSEVKGDVDNDSEEVTKADYPSATSIIKWLNGHAPTPGSVIYVSFGTQTYLSDAQLDEICHGLEMSGQAFVWAVRSKSWLPPEGMEERVKGRGLIIREWAPQRRILMHPAMGGFLSHCGWNSVLESISAGVPILAWPMIAEQSLNAKFVVEELKAGEMLVVGTTTAKNEIAIGRTAICKGVKELMSGEKGRRARERAEELGRIARQTTCEGGSSYKSLSQMIERLCN